MNPDDHRREALNHLDRATAVLDMEDAAYMVARAQVHATLALSLEWAAINERSRLYDDPPAG